MSDKINFAAAFNKTQEELMAMDEAEFRARFRERCHHTMEIQVYAAAHSGRTLDPEQCKTVRMFMDVWHKRGLPETLPEYVFADKMLLYADKLIRGESVDLTPYAPAALSEESLMGFEHVLYERRSVRAWRDEHVPDEVIKKILQAGLWAAHACNLQSVRYLVIREESCPGRFRGSDIPGGPVHIVLLQDMRVYRANPVMPESNQLLDAGAAGQNLVLAAHAYGLGGCWLTFTSEQMKQRIRDHVGLPEYIRLTTYVDVGFPEQTPYPPQRITVEEAVLHWE